MLEVNFAYVMMFWYAGDSVSNSQKGKLNAIEMFFVFSTAYENVCELNNFLCPKIIYYVLYVVCVVLSSVAPVTIYGYLVTVSTEYPIHCIDSAAKLSSRNGP